MKRRRTIKRRGNVIAIYPEDWVTCSMKNLRRFCQLPFPGHPKGCPMWRGKKACIRSFRNTQTFDNNFERSAPGWGVYRTFDLVKQEKRMKLLHPDWTVKQCRNPRYWQRTFRNALTDDVKHFFRKKQLWGKYGSFEAGFTLNFHATLWKAGLKLKRIRSHPDYAIRCTLIAKYKKGSKAELQQRKAGRQVLNIP